MTSRKPTQLKIVEGTARPDRMNPDEPQPDAVLEPPEPPVGLGRFGGREWRRLVPLLLKQRLLTVADLGMLELTCAAYDDWRSARSTLRREGRTFRTDSGQIKIHPTVRDVSDAWRRYKLGLEAFGQSPASRPKVSASHEDYVDPAEEFLGGNSSAPAT